MPAATAIPRAAPARDFGWIEQTVRRPASRESERLPGLLEPDTGAAPGARAVYQGRRRRSGLLQVASFHPKGYVREEVVRLFAGTELTAALPCLLVRLNDWVRAVQLLAAEAVGARLGLELRRRCCGAWR